MSLTAEALFHVMVIAKHLNADWHMAWFQVRIAIVGKYIGLSDAYLSVLKVMHYLVMLITPNFFLLQYVLYLVTCPCIFSKYPYSVVYHSLDCCWRFLYHMKFWVEKVNTGGEIIISIKLILVKLFLLKVANTLSGIFTILIMFEIICCFRDSYADVF